MNTREIELLSEWNEQTTTEAVIAFVRETRRMPDYDELLSRLRVLTLTEV